MPWIKRCWVPDKHFAMGNVGLRAYRYMYNVCPCMLIIIYHWVFKIVINKIVIQETVDLGSVLFYAYIKTLKFCNFRKTDDLFNIFYPNYRLILQYFLNSMKNVKIYWNAEISTPQSALSVSSMVRNVSDLSYAQVVGYFVELEERARLWHTVGRGYHGPWQYWNNFRLKLYSCKCTFTSW